MSGIKVAIILLLICTISVSSNEGKKKVKNKTRVLRRNISSYATISLYFHVKFIIFLTLEVNMDDACIMDGYCYSGIDHCNFDIECISEALEECGKIYLSRCAAIV